MQKRINIAIDGYASTGKSTLAKALAKRLNYVYIDSGAMYRAITLYVLQNKVDYEDEAAVIDSLQHINIHFETDLENQVSFTFLNGENVERLIRSKAVSEIVSEVSTIREVRLFLKGQQQIVGKDGGVVMDGRDIGTMIFPNAELKLFMSADFSIRTQRRYDEMLLKGGDMTLEEVAENLSHRDNIDTHREESPLYKADDAILLDNTNLTMEEQLNIAHRMALKAIESATAE